MLIHDSPFIIFWPSVPIKTVHNITIQLTWTACWTAWWLLALKKPWKWNQSVGTDMDLKRNCWKSLTMKYVFIIAFQLNLLQYRSYTIYWETFMGPDILTLWYTILTNQHSKVMLSSRLWKVNSVWQNKITENLRRGIIFGFVLSPCKFLNVPMGNKNWSILFQKFRIRWSSTTIY